MVALSRMRQPSLVSVPSTMSLCTGESSCASSDALDRVVETASPITAIQEETRSVLASSQMIV